MVKDGKGCNIGVEHLGIAEVANPCFVHYSLDEALDALLSGLVSLAVLKCRAAKAVLAQMQSTQEASAVIAGS